MKNNFADDGLPLFRSIQDMQSDASDFISYVHNNNMRVHLEGKKAMTYLIFGEDAKKVKENSIEIESNCDSLKPKLECLRTRDVRLLGQSLNVRDEDGAPICDMSLVVGRLKEAASALRAISANCLSSTAIHVIKTYIVSIMSYSIVNWYPNLFQYLNSPDQKVRRKAMNDFLASRGSLSEPQPPIPMSVRCRTTNSLSEIRYWFMSCQAYVCVHEKSILGWTNSSRSITMDSTIEAKLRVLTGIPSLEELYVASCISHYRHFEKIVRLKMENHKVSGPLVFHPRTGRLLYVGREVKGRVSPLRLLVENANLCCQVTKLKPNIRDSFLVQVESRKYKLTREQIRQMQKCLSLAHFKKLDASILKRPAQSAIGEQHQRTASVNNIGEQVGPNAKKQYADEEAFIVKNNAKFRHLKRRLELHKVWDTIELADPFAKVPLFKPAT